MDMELQGIFTVLMLHAAGLTLTFIDIVFVNGLADDNSMNGPFGGSFDLSRSTNIFERCLFYNNRATSSTGNTVRISPTYIHENIH